MKTVTLKSALKRAEKLGLYRFDYATNAIFYYDKSDSCFRGFGPIRTYRNNYSHELISAAKDALDHKTERLAAKYEEQLY